MRYLLPILLLLLWFFLSWRFVDNKKTACCGAIGNNSTAVVSDSGNSDVASENNQVGNANNDLANANSVGSNSGENEVRNSEVKVGPIVFNRSNNEAILGSTFPNYRDSILQGLQDDQLLEITGQYYADEKNNTTFGNLGIARAEEAKKYFAEKMSGKEIRTNSQLLTGSQSSDPFAATNYRYLTNTDAIKEIADRTLIYFDSGSNNRKNANEIDTYLNDVAERVKKTGENIQLTGHTDSVGGNDANKRLGQKRADSIKQSLVNKGVSASKIITSSEGENKPMATNETAEGRQQNRRTELLIVK